MRKFYAPLLEAKYDHVEPRLRDLEQLELIASRYRSRPRMLLEMTLDPPSSTQDFAGPPVLDDDYLVLSTIHSAKGLEWDAVYVIHAADGNIPSDMATKNPEEIEEERRLFYVALTRAKNWLYVCYPLRYYWPGRSDRHTFSQRTRFLPEKAADVLRAMRHRAGGDDDDDEFDAVPLPLHQPQRPPADEGLVGVKHSPPLPCRGHWVARPGGRRARNTQFTTPFVPQGRATQSLCSCGSIARHSKPFRKNGDESPHSKNSGKNRSSTRLPILRE